MRGCRKRTARLSVTSRERMRIISPRTPRNSGSALRAPQPRQSMTTSDPPGVSPSTPKRISPPFARKRSVSADNATRGSRWPSSAKNRPLRKRPPRSGSSLAMRASSTGACDFVRAAKRSISLASRGGATTSVPSRVTPGTRASHQSIAPWPSSTTLSGALSPSQNGASMPPASHDALPPISRERSRSVTFAPRAARVSSVVRPATPAPTTVARMTSFCGIDVERPALVQELARLLRHAGHRLGFLAKILRDLHRTELRPAHRAEMRDLVTVLRQGLVVEFARRVGVEGQVELVLPAEVEARARHGVITDLRGRMTLGEVRCMGSNAVSDDPSLDVLAVGQAKMLLRRHVAEHRGAEPADHRGADTRRDVIVARRNVRGQRPERIEGRLPAFAKLLLHIDLDLVHRHMTRALDHHLATLVPRDLGQFAERLQFRELRTVVGVGDRARAQAVAERERDIILAHDVADLVKLLVKKALAVAREAPARHDRAAARDNSGYALRCQRHIGQAHAGVDGEIIDALLGLLDQRVLEHLPVELQRIAANLLQRLVDRHRADRDRRVAQNPGADVMDITAGRKVHNRVGAPADRPRHFLDFLGDARAHRRIADVGVDLDQEIAADLHRLEFEVIDVGGDDRAPSGHFIAHEFRRDEFGNGGAEALAIAKGLSSAFHRGLAREILAMSDIDHLFGDDPRAGEFELRDELARLARAQRPLGGAQRREAIRRNVPIILWLDRAWLRYREVTGFDPGLAHWLEPGGKIDRDGAFGIGPGRIVHPDRRLVGIGEHDLAERNADVGAAAWGSVDFARACNGPGGHGLRRGEFGNLVHGRLLAYNPTGERADQRKNAAATSLRRHDPDQVQRVRLVAVSAPRWDAPRA